MTETSLNVGDKIRLTHHPKEYTIVPYGAANFGVNDMLLISAEFYAKHPNYTVEVIERADTRTVNERIFRDSPIGTVIRFKLPGEHGWESHPYSKRVGGDWRSVDLANWALDTTLFTDPDRWTIRVEYNPEEYNS
jgi:hypothetical protein